MKLLSCALAVSAALLATSAVSAEINVYAASSLTDVLKQIGADYERQSGDRVSFNFAATSTLARQIEEGAPADIFVSADEPQIDRLVQNANVIAETRRTLLSNTLVVIAPADSQLTIDSPAQLATVSRVAIADPNIVPVGVYARAYLTRANLWDSIAPKVIPVENVRAAVAAVESGNVDAGFAYATDARISKHVKVIFAVPAEEEPRISYPAAMINGSKNRTAAEKFLNHLQSDAATKVFESHGFIVPREKR